MKLSDSDILELDYLFENAEIYQDKGFDENGFRNISAEVTTLVLHDHIDDALPPSLLEQLMKILGAIGLQKEQVHIFKHNEGLRFTDQWPFEKVLLFGASVPPFSKAAERQKYRPFQVMGKQVIFADGLAELTKDVAKKKRLWTALQKMFKLA